MPEEWAASIYLEKASGKTAIINTFLNITHNQSLQHDNLI
jgi:hypothetical protein